MAAPAGYAPALHAVADRHERTLAAAIERWLLDVQRAVPAGDVLAAFASGAMFDLPTMIPWDDLFRMPTVKRMSGDDVTDSLLSTMYDASTEAGLPAGRFTLTNPLAIRYAKEHAAELVRYLSDEQRRLVNRVITDAVRGRYTADEAARIFTRSVGLDPVRSNALARYAEQAHAAYRGDVPVSALRRGGLAAPKAVRSSAAADRLVDRYGRKLLRDRAEAIARTEIMRAANRGITLNFQQAAANGHVNTAHAYREWIVTDDDRLCDECLPMDGAIVPFYDPFVSTVRGTDIDNLVEKPTPTTTMEPPLHVNCRCIVWLVQ